MESAGLSLLLSRTPHTASACPAKMAQARNGLSTIKEAGESSFKVEKTRLDEKRFPQPTGEFETIEADSLVLALGQDVDLESSTAW